MPEPNRNPAITILVVEDEYFVREVIVGYLQEAGCAVVEADTGERAIEICNSGMPVDVVFTDIQLPGSASGFDVAETFRAAHADMPIMYVSGNSGNRDRCVGGSLFFQKPYRATEILTACLRLKNLSHADVARSGLGGTLAAREPDGRLSSCGEVVLGETKFRHPHRRGRQ